jgi:hypothetical protein
VLRPRPPPHERGFHHLRPEAPVVPPLAPRVVPAPDADRPREAPVRPEAPDCEALPPARLLRPHEKGFHHLRPEPAGLPWLPPAPPDDPVPRGPELPVAEPLPVARPRFPPRELGSLLRSPLSRPLAPPADREGVPPPVREPEGPVEELPALPRVPPRKPGRRPRSPARIPPRPAPLPREPDMPGEPIAASRPRGDRVGPPRPPRAARRARILRLSQMMKAISRAKATRAMSQPIGMIWPRASRAMAISSRAVTIRGRRGADASRLGRFVPRAVGGFGVVVAGVGDAVWAGGATGSVVVVVGWLTRITSLSVDVDVRCRVVGLSGLVAATGPGERQTQALAWNLTSRRLTSRHHSL